MSKQYFVCVCVRDITLSAVFLEANIDLAEQERCETYLPSRVSPHLVQPHLA